MNDAGRIGFVLCGDYDENKTYEFLDVVSYGNGSYAAKKTTTGVVPGDLSTWQKLTEGGASIATASTLGIVKPDNTTIIIDPDGTIHGNSKITVDSELSTTSRNPVENRIITQALNNMPTGGSTIVVKTEDTTLFGQNVTITDGQTSKTIKFDANGVAVFNGIKFTGLLTVTATNGTLTAENTIEVPYYGNYALGLEFWAADINISTITSQFNGKTITIKKDGETIGTTVFASNSAYYRANLIGTYTFEVILGWRTFTSSIEVTEEKAYTVTLDGFIATINFTTTSTEFYGLPIEISSDDVPTATVTFDRSGRATYTAYIEGSYKATLVYQGEEYTNTIDVTSQMSYSMPLNRWTAPITISTTSSQFFSKQITVKKDGIVVGTTSFNAMGDASYNAHTIGLYSFEVVVGWRTFKKDCDVTTEQSYSLFMQGYESTINVSTTASEFYGATVTVTSDEAPTSTIQLSSSGKVTYTALKEGRYVFSLEYDGDTYSDYVEIGEEGTYSVTIKYWTATIQLSTSSTEMYGAPIVIADENGVQIGSVNFDSLGNARYLIHKTGIYSCSVTIDGFVYTKKVTVSNETVYLVTLNTWTAIVNISTSSDVLYGKSITITKSDGTFIGTTIFSQTGSAIYYIHEPDSYTFSVEVDD